VRHHDRCNGQDRIGVSVEDLTWAVGELAEMSTGDFEVDDLLRRLCEVAGRTLAVHGVGVMKTLANGETRFVQVSDPSLAGLESLQETLQEGPCRDSLNTGQMVAAASVREMVWPAFRRAAAVVGVQALLAVPLLSRGRAWGTLDLYWNAEHDPTDQDRAAAQLLANVVVSYLVMVEDRATSRKAQQQLAHQVLHDQLTGLPNRGLIEELIEHALSGADRRGTLVAVLFIDVDDFKIINDTYGHRAGDQVLQVLAGRMQGAVRAGDTVGRISGDEFIVACQDLPRRDDAMDVLTRVGDRLRTAITQPIELSGSRITVTASIGIAVTTAHPTPDALIHAADVAMYRAKRTGRGGGIAATSYPAA
jgi:diguanylate cyclase (GGDEF)-like protein